MLLELGGNGPMIVLEDADLSRGGRGQPRRLFLCAGQSCTAGERFLVHEAVHDEFVERLRAAVEREIRLGDPLRPETTMGPLNNEPTAAKFDRHVADALDRGAELVRRRRARRGLPDRPVLPADRAGWRHRGDGGRARGDVRAGRPDHRRRQRRERCSSTNASPYGLLTARLDRGPGARPGLRRGGRRRLGEHQRVDQPVGVHLPVRRPRRAAAAGAAASAASYPMDTFTEPKTIVYPAPRYLRPGIPD